MIILNLSLYMLFLLKRKLEVRGSSFEDLIVIP